MVDIIWIPKMEGLMLNITHGQWLWDPDFLDQQFFIIRCSFAVEAPVD